MSGFVVINGAAPSAAAEKLSDKIRHRGPDMIGYSKTGNATAAQRYLLADTAGASRDARVPVQHADEAGPLICYDGQLGNYEQLASAYGIEDGPFREERLLLEMYQQKGRGMLSELTDGIYAFAIIDGENLLAARDPLGIKTLFFGRQDKTLFLASELKCLAGATEEVHEFPAGHSMDSRERLERFGGLPEQAPEPVARDVATLVSDIQDIVGRSVRRHVDFARPTAGLLSGGMDSSVICYLAAKHLKEQNGEQARLATYAMGVGESGDILNARIMAEHIQSDHTELLVDLDEMLAVLPTVIYHLESFDPSLVRSAVSNFLISKHAGEHGFEILLSGEGGDEIFCGYTYLKDTPLPELTAKQIECLGYLHNNASLRLDRMNACHSVRVVAPLISGELLDYALQIPPEYKQHPNGDGRIEKWAFRKAFEACLPEAIVWRGKQEFSQGSGSAGVLPDHFEAVVSDAEYAATRERYPLARSKEEAHYLKVFVAAFGDGHAINTVGQWPCL